MNEEHPLTKKMREEQFKKNYPVDTPISKALHTPVQWKLQGNLIVSTRSSNPICRAPSRQTNRLAWEDFNKTNGEFIVRACNCYDELLKACEMMVKWVELENSDEPEIEQLTLQTVMEHVEHAIAKAKGPIS